MRGFCCLWTRPRRQDTYINHEKATEDMSITDAYLRITMETKNFEHIDSILTALSDAGFTYQQF